MQNYDAGDLIWWLRNGNDSEPFVTPAQIEAADRGIHVFTRSRPAREVVVTDLEDGYVVKAPLDSDGEIVWEGWQEVSIEVTIFPSIAVRVELEDMPAETTDEEACWLAYDQVNWRSLFRDAPTGPWGGATWVEVHEEPERFDVNRPADPGGARWYQYDGKTPIPPSADGGGADLKRIFMELGNRLVAEYAFLPGQIPGPEEHFVAEDLMSENTALLVFIAEWLNEHPEARDILADMGIAWRMPEGEDA